MIQKEWDMQSLSDAFLQSVRRYGIKEVSMGQYEVVCKKIVHFSSEHGFSAYYMGLKTDYDAFIDAKVHDKSICYEYGRFQHRVIRMMASLAETGKTDFSGCFNPPKRYTVSDQSEKLIEKVLDYHSLRGESKTEMSTVMRHFFKYAEDKSGTADVEVTDDLLMDFFTKELPKTNKGSMGRSLRAVRYLSAYLKNNGNAELLLDFTQLTARGHHVRVIPPYSQKEINRAVSSIDITTPEGLRDYAIMLLAFDTGLRSVDIRTLCLGDIDWNKGLLYLAQSKTGAPLILPLSGRVMNAIADYILTGRPECSHDEIFLTVKGPVRPMNKRHGAFSSLCDKYFNAADVDKIPGRSFHSLRRSFATELSEAGVPLETISQMLGHKSIGEDKPYLSYNREQIAFCAIGFDEIPVTHGIYAGGVRNDNINDYLKDYLDKMMEFREAAGYATATYKITLMPFIDFCCSNYKDASVLTSDMLDEWLTHKRYTLNTQAVFIACLRQYCRYINFLGRKAYIPDEDYTLKRIAYEPYIFTDTELRALFCAIDGYGPSTNNKKYRPELVTAPMFRMMYCCGMRPSEPLRLRCSDINLDAGDIYIRETKKHKDRHIIMSRDMLHLCREYDELAGKRTWFFEYGNKPYDRRWMTAQFGHCWKRSGLGTCRKPRPYDLRHAFATRNLIKWIDNGLDINNLLPYLSAYMGHSELNSTFYYIHLLPERIRNSAGVDWKQFSSIYVKEGGSIED